MKQVKSLLFLVFTLPFYFTQAQSSKEIIEKYLEVTNTKDNLEIMKNFTYKKKYVANAATDFEEEVSVIENGTRLSRKKSILDRDFFYVLNGSQGWIRIPMGSRDKAPNYTVKDLNAKERDELRNEVMDGLLPFVNFEAKGYKQVGTVRSALINGTDCFIFNIEKGDIKREYAFDKSSGFLKREIFINKGITHTTDHTKYGKTKNDIQYPIESNYENSKDKKKTKVTSEWILETLPAANLFVK
jgi:hypothetical protein